MMRFLLFTCTLALVFSSGMNLFAQERVDIPGPGDSVTFGETVKVLPNGNFVVVDSSAGYASSNYGAVFLYNGATRQLISRLHGSNTQDRVGGGGGGVDVLPHGDFIVRSPNWNKGRGAVTYCSKSTGCDGAVSPTNSLVGFATDNHFGNSAPIILPNGNFVIPMIGYIFPGAVAFFDGFAPTVGEVSVENSLIGQKPADRVGQGGVSVLSNGGYVVESPDWNEGLGAVTFCDGTTGCKGFISASNSLVGQNPGNRVGNSPVYMESSVKEIGNGNYLVISASWDNGPLNDVGAVTWLNASQGLSGTVSIENSLVGASANTKLGRVTVLENGNYVVLWAVANTGGATFGTSENGVFGIVSEANSLVGTGANNDFYLASVVPLKNGNYVVNAPTYDFGRAVPTGGTKWCSGTVGCAGQMTVQNSLVGAGNYGYTDPVIPLANGNYVVRGNRSATFGNGNSGVTGYVTTENSLVSPNHGGLGLKIVPLPNGNYYVLNSNWDPPAAPGGGSRGAVTFGDGLTGVVGTVSEANSLVNERSGDTSEFSTRLLPSGDLLLLNARWNNYRGAVTRLSATAPQIGLISAQNSVVGTNPYDYVGAQVNVLANGNYVVVAYNWNGIRGAVRLCNWNQPCIGEMNESNSLVGTSPNDRVGGGNNLTGVIEVNNTHFVVSSPNWNGDRGAATLINSNSGLTGPVGPQNSLVGSSPLDLISNGDFTPQPPVFGTTDLGYGLLQIYSPAFANPEHADAGAITFGSINIPPVGEINASNSIFGTAAGTARTYSFVYDPVNRQVVVGQRNSNIVSIYKFNFIPPTSVNITGTLEGPDGRPLYNTLVKLTGEDGSVIWRTTKLLGNFEFRDVPTMRTYTFTVMSKRFRFSPRQIPNITADVNFGPITGQRFQDISIPE